jgi:peptide/nickel transport system substrate-binding protein
VKRDALLGQLHAYIVDQYAMIFVAHDVGSRALSPRISKVVQTHNWLIDVAIMSMK